MIYLDTHVAVWLYSGDLSLISEQAAESIESNELLISPAVLMELQFLYEIKRIKTRPAKIREYLEAQIGLRVCEIPFISVISHSLLQSWTRDPFDRIITGQAKARGNTPLLTKDRNIREHYPQALWD